MRMHPELRSLQTNDALTGPEWDEATFSSEGIPLLVADPKDYVEGLGSEWNAELEALPFHALAHLARYLPQLQDHTCPLRLALRETLTTHVGNKVELAIEAGCSVGADLQALSNISERVIGFDAYITPLRYAMRYLSGQSMTIPRRNEGRGFTFVEHEIGASPMSNVSLLCADALNPPFLPECADVVVAMNLLDNVPSPLNLLAQMDAILKPGGLMIVASPFNWNDSITPPNEQIAGSLDPEFEGLDSSSALLKVMEGRSSYHPHLMYTCVGSQDVDWKVREHDRCAVHFRVHLCTLRKSESSR